MGGSGIFPIPPGTWAIDVTMSNLAAAWSTDQDVRIEVRPLTWGQDIALLIPVYDGTGNRRGYESTEKRVGGERHDIAASTPVAIREAVFSLLRDRKLLREDLP